MNLGTWRRLSTLANADGMFNILAIDHRDSLRAVLNPSDAANVEPKSITDVKLDLLTQLGHLASGAMLEPEYSIGPALARRSIPPTVGFTAAIEAQGYLEDSTVTHTTILEGWSVEQAARVGASAAKLLALWNPQQPTACRAQIAVIKEVVDECRRYELPLFLEPILTGPSIEHQSGRQSALRSMLKEMTGLGADVLKLGLIADQPEETCATIEASVGETPWALLSGGVSFQTFAEQLRRACEAGASGFMVGRALWGEYVQDPTSHTARSDLTTRFSQLRDITSQRATPWFTHVDPPSEKML